MSRQTAPDRGDVVWITMNPALGHEQKGRRPAFVVSPRAYNAKVGLAVMCPITSQQKGYPFEVPLPPDLPLSGVVLADQVKSLDWRERRAEVIGAMPPELLADVLARIEALLF